MVNLGTARITINRVIIRKRLRERYMIVIKEIQIEVW